MGWLASNAIRHCDWRIGLYDLLPAQSRTSTNLREWFRTSFQVQRVLSHVCRRQRPFMLQQPGLACHPAAIAGHLAIGADDPTAGHADADGLCPIGTADGANARGLPAAARQPALPPPPARRNFASPAPGR